ncbi:MAG: DUF1059 domain-containing protein, partial [Gemmatimonadales bacterium]
MHACDGQPQGRTLRAIYFVVRWTVQTSVSASSAKAVESPCGWVRYTQVRRPFSGYFYQEARMAKTYTCRDVGVDCDWKVRGNDEADVMR